MKLLEVNNLSIRRRREGSPAIEDISFYLEEGQTLGVVGESGAGKSTLALAIAGLLDGTLHEITGEILFRGRNMLSLSEKELGEIRGPGIGMIFQDAAGSLNPTLPVNRQVAEAVRRSKNAPAGKAASIAQANRLLADLGLDERLLKGSPYPFQLSGGLCQRVMIAAALAPGPALLIADEPTSSLDMTVQTQIVQILKEKQASSGLALVFVTHDLALVSTIASRLLVMQQGRMLDHGDFGEVLANPGHAYTAGIIEAWSTAAGFGGDRLATA